MEVITPKRAYQMAADTEADLREWEWAIDRALSYLRELQLDREDGGMSSNRKSGLLMKKGGKRHNWKLRWFVLDKGRLAYYSSKPDKRKAPLGTIELEHCLMVTRVSARSSPAAPARTAAPARLAPAPMLLNALRVCSCLHSRGCVRARGGRLP